MTFIMTIVQWLLSVFLCLVSLFLLSLYIRGAFRWRPLFHIKDAIAPNDPRFLAMLKTLTGSLETTGQITEVWETIDDIQAARLAAINSAKHSIQFETFIMTPGRRAEAFADAIARRAIEGITVQLLVDHYGVKSLDQRYWQRLCSAGVQVVFFNPFDWRAPANYAGRSHRKLLIIDSDRALIGGAGISDMWDGTEKSDDTKPWLDVEVAMVGEVVTILSTIFQKHWQGYRKKHWREGREITAIDMGMVYPNANKPIQPEETQPEETQLEDNESETPKTSVQRSASSQYRSKAGSSFIVTPGTKPSYRNSPIGTLKQTLIASARRNIWLASPYFLPNKSTRNLLIDAQKMGVHVRILTTSERSDKKPVYYASCEVYGPLLKAGIEIFEYQPSMIHAKMLMVDHTWVNIGSANLDYRSFLHNDELDILTDDAKLVRTIKHVFEKGFEASQKISFSQWKQRSLVKQRLIGNAVRLIQWQL